MSRIKLLMRYIKNDRVKEYESIIKKALENDYEIISMRDYIEKNYNIEKKVLILRHDIDSVSNATKMMFDVECKYSVKSSFYFRNSTLDTDLIKAIERYGSEASLHFESIADFLKANPEIKSKKDLVSTDFKERCLQILHCDLNRFRLLCDVPCLTIASHGEHENRLVGVPNNYLTEEVDVYSYLGIELEAYKKEFIDNLSSYISDMPILINNGYRYNNTPFNDIEKNKKVILFLTHPEHWYLTLSQRIKVSIIGLLKGPIYYESTFKRT